MQAATTLLDTPNSQFVKYVGFAKHDKPNLIFIQDSKLTNYIYNCKNLQLIHKVHSNA